MPQGVLGINIKKDHNVGDDPRVIPDKTHKIRAGIEHRVLKIQEDA
jgi:hypothetical protein